MQAQVWYITGQRTGRGATGLAAGKLDRIELPGVGDALEAVGAAVAEGEPGPGDQVLDRPRADDLARPGGRHHPGGDVHGDPADVLAEQLDLARVQPHPDLQAQVAQAGADGGAGPDGPGRPVEGGQEPVAGGLDLAAAEAGQLLAHRLLVVDQETMPAAGAPGGGGAGRA